VFISSAISLAAVAVAFTLPNTTSLFDIFLPYMSLFASSSVRKCAVEETPANSPRAANSEKLGVKLSIRLSRRRAATGPAATEASRPMVNLLDRSFLDGVLVHKQHYDICFDPPI